MCSFIDLFCDWVRVWVKPWRWFKFSVSERASKLSFRAFSSRRSSLTQPFIESCVDFVYQYLWFRIAIQEHHDDFNVSWQKSIFEECTPTITTFRRLHTAFPINRNHPTLRILATFHHCTYTVIKAC